METAEEQREHAYLLTYLLTECTFVYGTHDIFCRCFTVSCSSYTVAVWSVEEVYVA